MNTFPTTLPTENIQREAEITVKEWAEHFRPVRQRTVPSQTTKDKAGALPPAVYEKAKSGTWSGVSFPEAAWKVPSASVSNEPELDNAVHLSTSSNCAAVTGD